METDKHSQAKSQTAFGIGASLAIIALFLFWVFWHFGFLGRAADLTGDAGCGGASLVGPEAGGEAQDEGAGAEVSGAAGVAGAAGSASLEALPEPLVPLSEAQGRPEPSVSSSCPVPFPSDCRGVTYKQGIAVESWQGFSALDCRIAARDMLLDMREGGFELIRAEFLDFSRDAWGCTVSSQEAGTLIISLIPEKLGASEGQGGSLTVTAVRIKAVDSEFGSDVGGQ